MQREHPEAGLKPARCKTNVGMFSSPIRCASALKKSWSQCTSVGSSNLPICVQQLITLLGSLLLWYIQTWKAAASSDFLKVIPCGSKLFWLSIKHSCFGRKCFWRETNETNFAFLNHAKDLTPKTRAVFSQICYQHVAFNKQTSSSDSHIFPIWWAPWGVKYPLCRNTKELLFRVRGISGGWWPLPLPHPWRSNTRSNEHY